MNKSHFYSSLVGHHLYLRQVCIGDVNENYCKWMNDPEVIQYLESRFESHSIESLLEYVKRFQGDKDNMFFAIVLKGDHKHIGNIKIGPINWFHRFADIGIMIGEKSYWGRGYASEAIILLVEHAFRNLDLHKVTAGCYEQNQGAIKAFQKAGFGIEGIRKKHCLSHGKYVDSILLGQINTMEKKVND
jgi:[ribosomal protein S5]-alanine N-acetyltransferase